MAICNRLFEIRTQRELTQDDVARLTGVSRVTVGRVDRNRHYRPKGKTMQDLARGLRLRIGELFDDDELAPVETISPTQAATAAAGSTPDASPPPGEGAAVASGDRAPDLVAAGATRVALARNGSAAVS
ncbi:MAG: helix-turn-helix transcriptional regulator [Chloroflexota bacterium]